jgi:hypothetical protein
MSATTSSWPVASSASPRSALPSSAKPTAAETTDEVARSATTNVQPATSLV